MQCKFVNNSIMFHHFHDSKHPDGQGALSSADFENMIDWLGRNHIILNADEYLAKFESNELNRNEICLTFDDALLCQYEIATPILNKRGIKAFFFIYSSPLCGEPDSLELYRFFRTTAFAHVDQFYDQFILQMKCEYEEAYAEAIKIFNEKTYLSASPFYTRNDKFFRFLRDAILGKFRYEKIMNKMMDACKFNKVEACKKLWMSNENIQELDNVGHVIGLHSYSHSTTFNNLKFNQQEEEYGRNFDHLNSLLRDKPIAMSHPCGNYNEDTLKILKRLGIRIGFRCDARASYVKSIFEVPREDHANILNEMKNENHSIY